MLNTIRELPVTLQEIKRDAQEDELISATKQKIADKNQDCGYFLVVLQRTIIWLKGGYTQDLTELDIERLPRGSSKKEQDEEPIVELRVLSKNGHAHFQ